MILWAAPRTASTAFARSITASHAHKFYFEPYSVAEHCGPDGRIRIGHVFPEEPDYHVESVKKWLEAECETNNSVFVKDHAYAVHGRYNVLPKGYKHTFLIRKPESCFKSFYRVFKAGNGFEGDSWQDWLPADVNVFQCLYDLAQYVEITLKEEICIIDSDDIAANPGPMIEKYCNNVGFRYSRELLQWQPGVPEDWVLAPTYLRIERDYNWLGNAITSTGWGVGVKNVHPTNEEFPDEIFDMINSANPFYEKLRAHPSFIHA